MTYNAYYTALQTIHLAFRFLLALPAVAAFASPLACVFDTVLSALRRLSVDDMGMTYSPVLFDDDQDPVEWICGVEEKKTADPVSDSLSAPPVGKPSGNSLGEYLLGLPGLEPHERLFLKAIDAGGVGIHQPTTMEEVREQFPDELNRGVLRMFTGPKDKRPAGTPVRRETFLGEETPFTFFAKLEGRTPKNDWLRKTYLADESDELFSEVTWKQEASAEFVNESLEVVPDTADGDERHKVPNKVGFAHSVYRDMDTSVEGEESHDEESSDDGSSVNSLLCSSLVADLPTSGGEVTEDEIADLVSRLESLSIDDASEHSVFETEIDMDAVFSGDDAVFTDYVSIMDLNLIMMQNLEMMVLNTVQQVGDVGEEVASGAVPFFNGGNFGKPFVFGQEASQVQFSAEDLGMVPQYEGLVGEPFVFGQEVLQGLVPQMEALMELTDASPDAQFPGSEMNVSLETEPVRLDGPEFSGLVDAGTSTAGVMGEVFDSAVVAEAEALHDSVLAEATVEATPGFEGVFDGCQKTDEVNWDDYVDFTSCPVSDSNELPVAEMECSSPPVNKLITNEGAACVPQQAASDVQGKGKEAQGQQSKVDEPSPSQGQSVEVSRPVFVFGAGNAEGSKDGLNKPSAPAFVFGSGMAQKCEFGSYNVPKIPGLYGVPTPPNKTSKPVVVPDDEARLTGSCDDAEVLSEVPLELEAFENSQVLLQSSLISLLMGPPQRRL
ncbi:hypothetical protein CLU79DRAFT_885120 [Phycomyces nitens]|nr:hypothetical protein CLU79DRAFT_885120 [Phycomyces nitens]